MAQQSEGEVALSLRGVVKEIHELNHELKTMQSYMYKLKNQHRRTLYFRATSSEAEGSNIRGQQSKNALNVLYKEAFKRLHKAARHLGTEIGSVRFVRETLALLTCVASIGDRLKRCARLLSKIEAITLDPSLAASLASTVIVRKNTSLAASADQPSEANRKTKKRKKRKHASASDYSGEERTVASQTASLLQSGGWDLLK